MLYYALVFFVVGLIAGVLGLRAWRPLLRRSRGFSSSSASSCWSFISPRDGEVPSSRCGG